MKEILKREASPMLTSFVFLISSGVAAYLTLEVPSNSLIEIWLALYSFFVGGFSGLALFVFYIENTGPS